LTGKMLCCSVERRPSSSFLHIETGSRFDIASLWTSIRVHNARLCNRNYSIYGIAPIDGSYALLILSRRSMKILDVPPEQNDPSLGHALATAGKDILFSSATQLGEATHWIFSNLDVAALILDAQFGQPQCAAFLKDLRTRGLSAPVILLASE